MFCVRFFIGLVVLFCCSCLLVFVVPGFFLVEAEVVFLSFFNKASNTSWLKHLSEVTFVLIKSDSQTRYGHVEKVRKTTREKEKKPTCQ